MMINWIDVEFKNKEGKITTIVDRYTVEDGLFVIYRGSLPTHLFPLNSILYITLRYYDKKKDRWI